MKITFFGQSCFLVETEGKRILFDPFIKDNELASHINIEDIRADYVLLTHAHADHVADAEYIARNNDALIVSCYETAVWYGNKGLKFHPMNIGGKWKFDFGNVKYVMATHSSALPDGTYGGQAGGFVIWNDEGSFYHAGDTGLTMDMKLIPLTCPPLDFAILPLGDNFTMSVDDAVLAAGFISCNNIIGCHYDTFGFIKIDHDKANASFASASKKLTLMEISQTLDI